MKAMYCEIERGRGSVRVNIYRGAEELEKAEERRARRREQCVAKQRSRTHIREVAGGFIGLAGFVMLMGMESQEALWGMAALGAAGIALIWPLVEPDVVEYLQDRLMEQTERIIERAKAKRG